MRQSVTIEPGHMEIQDAPEPVAGSGQAVVRIEAVGLCGSDYHLFLGDHPYANFPLRQGHELAGTIESLADDYDGPRKVGERVAIEPLIPCGTCFPCRHGHYNACASLKVIGAHVAGGLVDKLAVSASALFPAGDLSPELTALCEPMSIGCQAISRGRVTADDTVVVIGAGPIGQAVLLGSKERGAHVLVADRIASRLELAKEFGADVVVDTTTTDLATEVKRWTEGEGAAVVMEATGSPEVIRLAVDLVAASGIIVVIGLSDREVSIPVIEFTRKELNILGSRNNAGLFGEAVELVKRNRDRIGSLITHTCTLEEVPEVIRFAVDHPEQVEKVIVLFGDQAK